MKLLELIQDKNGKLSRTGLMFLVWMVFLMGILGYTTYHLQNKLADLPESYVYMSLVLCGTYTARRFLDDKFNVTPPTNTGTTPPKTP